MFSQMCRRFTFLLAALLFMGFGQVVQAKGKADSLAVAFGKVPFLWGVRLSPDGSKVSFLHMDATGIPVAVVQSTGGKPTLVAQSIPGKFDVNWCHWANNERLVCGFYGIDNKRNVLYAVTRLVAVNIDGSDGIVLMQKKLEEKLNDRLTQFQDNIVDWLPNDPKHVLVGEAGEKGGVGVSKLNIYTGNTRVEKRDRDGVRRWISDGRGTPRLRYSSNKFKNIWYFRLADTEEWSTLHESRIEDGHDSYYPLGFGQDRNALLVYKTLNGRLALVSEDLERQREDEVIFSHPTVDVSHSLRLGQFNRLVAVGYATDKPNLHYFDADIEVITQKISQAIPDKYVSVIDESWDKRFYLVLVGSDQDPGRYYRLDIQENRLQEIFARRPELDGYELAAMQPVLYHTRDDVEIPGYLTLPVNAKAERLPAVIMPHGGPESRDVWDFDWLSQYMAAQGYVVLQSNFRGSGGYGDEWAGEGGFRQWRLAINDINDGASWLIDEGIVDPERICIIGWSYGGYAALLSTLEAPDLYKCTVSIAGVTDPWTLITDSRKFQGGTKYRLEQIGTEEETIKQGSPLERAKEYQGPVMLFHGDRDINVAVRHSKKLHKALKKGDKNSELFIYKDTAHGIWRDSYRIDMLGKIGQFLEVNIGSNSGN